MTIQVALLRGINVGGNNVVKMADLRRSLGAAGLPDAETYIQSGNVVLATDLAPPDTAAVIERVLAADFGVGTRALVITADVLDSIVAGAPTGFGAEPQVSRDDVIFVIPPCTASQVADQLPARPGVDTIVAGGDAVYVSRVAARASQSKLSRISTLAIYPSVTIRNWNTTSRLLEISRRLATRRA